MKLKCRILEQDYDNIVPGTSFSEEYNETLDSGSIIIDHIPKIKKLKAFTDVFIWNADEEFYGYYNVGDEILASNVGATSTNSSETSFQNAPNVTTIQSDISFNLNDSNILFTSQSINQDNRLFPGIIDIWITNFIHDLHHSTTMPRWGVRDITFKFTLNNVGNIITGYYKLPIDRENNVTSDGLLKLEKSTNFSSDIGAPSVLYVPFTIEQPYIGDVTVVSGINFSFGTSAISVSSPSNALETDLYVIQAIEKPTLNYMYSYDYVKDGSNEVVEKLSFALNGLTKAEILASHDLELNVIARGYEFHGTCAKPIWNSTNQTIDLVFLFEGIQFLSGDGFIVPLSEVSEKKWACSNLDFAIMYRHAYYYVDLISSDILDGLYFAAPTKSTLPTFYKHLLVDDFKAEMLSLDTDRANRLYKYKISLMSETKRLEKTICPNISITQPIVGQKRTIWYYLNQFINLYSPKIKMKDKGNTWIYKNKYSLDARVVGDYDTNDKYIRIPLHEIFDDSVFAPEMSLSAPTLRELLSRLMIVKDCIPIVKNDVIYAMKISDTHGKFVLDPNNFSFPVESMNSGNYSTAFRREYGDAISQKHSTHLVEFLGFRTVGDNEGLMTLDNMELEARFPIYKINKLYICYFKAVDVSNSTTNTTYKKLVLVKQDITKLVLENTVRNTLAADWTEFQSHGWENISVEDMSKYRLLTLGFSVGSNVISGWGTKFSYIWDLFGWTKKTYTYLEMILNILDNKYRFGVNGYQFLDANESIVAGDLPSWDTSKEINARTDVVSPNNSANMTDKMKSMFFEMDYIGMYSGAIIHSKENTEDDDLMSTDNCSSSLSILEVDGLFEREKANRLANKEFSFVARFDTVTEMNSKNNVLGAEYEDEDEKAIIYHREYQIYDDCVLANFVGTHDYVLRNYFTTVFAKYRTYSYAGYSESVNRNENDKYTIYLSDDTCHYENDDNGLKSNIISSVLSAFAESKINDTSFEIEFDKEINGGYFTFNDNGIEKSYLTDANQFVSGYSLCFNIKLYDNMTNGTYIKQINCYDDGANIRDLTAQNSYVGSQLEWHKIPLPENDGFIQTIGCYFGHFNAEDYYKNYINNWADNKTNNLYSKFLQLPYMQINPTFKIGKKYDFFKDNKEEINFTLQYELVNQDDSVLVSEWIMKLTDFNNYIKLTTLRRIKDKENAAFNGFETRFYSYKGEFDPNFWEGENNSYHAIGQGIAMIFDTNAVEQQNILGENNLALAGCICSGNYSYVHQQTAEAGHIYTKSRLMKIELREIKEVLTNNGQITGLLVNAILTIQYIATDRSFFGTNELINQTKIQEVAITLNRNVSNTNAYEFNYEGIIVPYSADNNWRKSLKYEGHDSASDPDVVTSCAIVNCIYVNKSQTMFVLVSNQSLEQNLVYSQYYLNSLPNHLKAVPLSPEEVGDGLSFKDIFNIEANEFGMNYIKYHLAQNVINTAENNDFQIKSVQYWYYDREENGGDGYLHFVFGVNTTDEDGDTIQDKKIYISTLKSRRTEVYNNLHRRIGSVMNFAKAANQSKYGEQLFEEDD